MNKINKKEKSLQDLKTMVLYGQIKLEDIERSYRIDNPSIYASSFRFSRSNDTSKNYVDNLKILENDIKFCKNNEHKRYLMGMLFGYVELAPYQGDVEFETYRKIFEEKILQSL